MLSIQTYGLPTAKPPLVIAHGLFGSARNWGAIAKRLADTRQVIAVDMRNHGASPFHPTHSYADMAADLAEVIAAQGGRADVLGHSMGGKAAMVLALTQGDLVNRLIVADIAPVVYSHSQAHLVAAMQGLAPPALASRAEADRQLAGTVPDPPVRAFLLQSLDTKAQSWRLNLDVLGASMAAIVGWPETDGQFTGPTLFLSGADSDYVQASHRDVIKRLFPAAKFAKIPGAGHWLHADKPREFEAAVRVYLG